MSVTGRIVLVLAVGAAVRLSLLRTPFLWPDEATIARMGLVVLRGEFPVYFHGQPFMGALDAYLLAPLYVAVGASAFAAELLCALRRPWDETRGWCYHIAP